MHCPLLAAVSPAASGFWSRQIELAALGRSAPVETVAALCLSALPLYLVADLTISPLIFAFVTWKAAAAAAVAVAFSVATPFRLPLRHHLHTHIVNQHQRLPALLCVTRLKARPHSRVHSRA